MIIFILFMTLAQQALSAAKLSLSAEMERWGAHPQVVCISPGTPALLKTHTFPLHISPTSIHSSEFTPSAINYVPYRPYFRRPYNKQFIVSKNTRQALHDLTNHLQPLLVTSNTSRNDSFVQCLQENILAINQKPLQAALEDLRPNDSCAFREYCHTKYHSLSLGVFSTCIKDLWRLSSLPVYATYQISDTLDPRHTLRQTVNAEAILNAYIKEATTTRLMTPNFQKYSLVCIDKIPTKITDPNINVDTLNGDLYVPHKAVPVFLGFSEM